MSTKVLWEHHIPNTIRVVQTGIPISIIQPQKFQFNYWSAADRSDARDIFLAWALSERLRADDAETSAVILAKALASDNQSPSIGDEQ